METKDALIQYCLRLGDSSLILGQRMAEWCSKGPTLEEDIALTNVGLDLFGQTRILYDYITKLKADGTTEDSLAFKRNEREFYNRLLTERPNGHFGDTTARNFFFSAYTVPLYRALQNSNDETLAAFAEKSLKESLYHLRHFGEWIIRLGQGTDVSKAKIQQSIDELWSYTGDLFDENDADSFLIQHNIAVSLVDVKAQWDKTINEVLLKAGLTKPSEAYMHKGSNEGLHSEHLGHLLCEMQYIPRAYPNAEW